VISIDVDVPGFLTLMTETQERQLPFATKTALNAVALDVQKREREHLRDVFTLRRASWADQSIKITHFASKEEPFATIAIAPPDDRGDILGKFETDTEKTARGAHGVAIPVDARRSKADIVQGSQRPAAFALHQDGSRVVGADGTFIIDLGGGRQLLLQRQDLGKRAAAKAGRGTQERATVLFIFEPRVNIANNLKFGPTAETVVRDQWQARFSEAFDKAMETAR
jgi:hypothetical protein